MSILRHLITHPAEKVPGCWFAQGPQGAGKTAIYDVLKLVFGKDLCLLNKGLETLNGRWNGPLVGKKLIVVEEASIIRGAFLSAFDNMKHLLTGTTLVERKFLKMFPAANLFFVIVLSNHKSAVYLEDGDRRYNACELSTQRVRDKVYWDAFYEKCVTQSCADKFFTWLQLRQDFVSSFHSLEPPDTTLRREVLRASAPPIMRFVKELHTKVIGKRRGAPQLIVPHEAREPAPAWIQHRYLTNHTLAEIRRLVDNSDLAWDFKKAMLELVKNGEDIARQESHPESVYAKTLVELYRDYHSWSSQCGEKMWPKDKFRQKIDELMQPNWPYVHRGEVVYDIRMLRVPPYMYADYE